MDGVFAKASTAAFLLRGGKTSKVKELIVRFWNTETRYLGLRRDLTVPFEAPTAKEPIMLRPLSKSDIDVLLNTKGSGLTEDERVLRYWQTKIVEAEIPTCWVAVTSEGLPCYMQWLIGHADTQRAKSFYGRQFPEIGPQEALLEGAFTPAQFRGMGIMPCAMAQISEKATNLGARWVVTFVADDNTAALKGCQRAGFRPYVVRYRKWRRFRRHFSLLDIGEDARYPFEPPAEMTHAAQ